jgi:hypothetical protein
MLEEGDLGLLLPFYMLKYRHEVQKAIGRAYGGGDRDGENVLRMTMQLQGEIYGGYKEFSEMGRDQSDRL